MATFNQLILAPTPTAKERFGYSTAQRGDWLAVCNSPIDFVDGSASVYIYKLILGIWTWQQTLTLADAFSWSGNRLKIKISPDGTKLAVGASTGNSNKGRIYLFDRSGDTWTAASVTPTIVSPSITNWAAEGYSWPGLSWYFGTDLVLTNDLLIASQNPGGGWFGKAYAYTLSAPGTWAYEADITPTPWPPSAGGSNYGYKIAIDESSLSTDTIRIAIARKGEHDYYWIYGAVYLWTRTTGPTWTLVDTIWEGGGHTEPPAGGPGDYLQFGHDMTMGADKLIIKNYHKGYALTGTLFCCERDTGLNTYSLQSSVSFSQGDNNGSLSELKYSQFLFGGPQQDSNLGYCSLVKLVGGTWTFSESITADPRVFLGDFGTSVSLDTIAAVGAVSSVDGGTQGAVYMYSVEAPPVTNFTVDETSGADSLTVQFTDTSTNTPTSWAWDFGDGSTSTDQNPSHTFTSAGWRTVSLVATNDFGNDTETKSNYIFVGKSNFTATPLSGYPDLIVQFTDATVFMDPTSATIKTWTWNFGDGQTSTDQNPTHTYTNPGKYTVTLTVTEVGT